MGLSPPSLSLSVRNKKLTCLFVLAACPFPFLLTILQAFRTDTVQNEGIPILRVKSAYNCLVVVVVRI